MKSMHRTPMTILALGIVTVALFGGGVVWISQQTPIVRLHPLLKEHYKNETIDVRFLPGNSPRIEVLVPDELGADRYALGDVGVWALSEYYDLAPKSQVRTCRVLLLSDETRYVDIDRELMDMLRRAERQQPQLFAAAEKAGLKRGRLELKGVVGTGVHVELFGSMPELEVEAATKLAARIAGAVSRATFLSRVTVFLEAKGGKRASAWAGRDPPD